MMKSKQSPVRVQSESEGTTMVEVRNGEQGNILQREGNRNEGDTTEWDWGDYTRKIVQRGEQQRHTTK